MTHKIFPRCQDGDIIRVIFDEMEEKRSFETVVERLHKIYQERFLPILDKAGDEQATLEVNDLFKTTLQREVAQENLRALRKIFSKLHVINIFDNGKIMLVRYGKGERKSHGHKQT